MMYKTLWNYIKRYKSTYFLLSIFFFLEYWLSIVPTQEIRKLIHAMQNQLLTTKTVQISVVYMLLAMFLAYAASNFWIIKLYGLSTKLAYETKEQLFRKVVNMRQSFFQKFTSGDLVTRFSTDTQYFTDLIGYGMMSFFFALGTLIFVIVNMWMISWQVTLMLLPFLILTTVILHFITEKIDFYVEEQRNKVTALNTKVLEVVEGIRVMRAYGKKTQLAKAFKKNTEDLAKTSRKINLYRTLMGRVVQLLFGLGGVTLMLLGAYLFKIGNLNIADIIALQLFSVMIIDPVYMMSDFIVVVKTGELSYSKIQELLLTGDDLAENGTTDIKHFEQFLLEQYSFSYPQTLLKEKDKKQDLILKQIHFSVQKGQTIGVVGKTGSGKTTLIRQFLAQYPWGEGTFLLNGQAISSVDRHAIERLIAYVPQDHFLFSKTVFENIRIAQPEASDTRIQEAIALASFEKDLAQMSKGKDTLVGERGVAISGGQKQRLLLARAFLKSAEILILDDALSAIDMKTESRIIQNLQRERQGKTNIIIAHRLSSVIHADKIYVLDEGRIVEEGTHEQLLKNGLWYAEQYQRQSLSASNEL